LSTDITDRQLDIKSEASKSSPYASSITYFDRGNFGSDTDDLADDFMARDERLVDICFKINETKRIQLEHTRFG
jgi:hypothetical protein